MGNLHFAYQTIVPVRKTPGDASEQVTQLLFGDIVEEIGEERHWRHIRNLSDGYEGWADLKLLLPLDAGWLEQVAGWEYVFSPSLALTCSMHGIPAPQPLTLGCRVPVFKGQEDAQVLQLQIGAWKMEVPRESVGRIASPVVEDRIVVSQRYLGAPYLWGGKSLWGIDCSGFTQMVFAICGKQLPRDAHQQAKVGDEVGFANRLPGDLAFFNNDQGKVVHVGIVLEGGRIRHASGFVHEDWLRQEGIFGSATQLQTHKLCSIKRIH